MRFAAADLAVPASRARAIAIVVWVGTLGSVLGPNLGVPGQWIEERWGLPDYSGAFALAAALMALAGLAILVLLRPDPLLLALRLRAEAGAGDRTLPDDGPATVRASGAPASDTEAVAAVPAAEAGGAVPAGQAVAAAPGVEAGAGTAPVVTTRRPRVRAALRLVFGIPRARFALVSQVLAHLVMVSVMTMTPVHLEHHTPHDLVVTVVGIVISFHVIGMFGFAPLVGILSDRLGPVPVILMGQVVLAVGSTICAVAGDSNVVVGVGLFLVGLGWSIVTVPSAALLTGSVTAAQRPVVQGSGDMLMNAVAAIGAMVSGPVVSFLGYPTLCLATLPFMALVTVLAFRLRRVADWSPSDPLS
jgi:MFS family permease